MAVPTLLWAFTGAAAMVTPSRLMANVPPANRAQTHLFMTSALI